MKYLLLLALSFVIQHVEAQRSTNQSSNWVGVIVLDTKDKDAAVPFNMEIRRSKQKIASITVKTANDRIEVKEIEQHGDSTLIKMPVFISEITFKEKKDSLVGRYYPKGKSKGPSYAFYAVKNKSDRFYWHTDKPQFNISGRWKYIVNPTSATPDTLVAEFKQQGARFTGALLDPTGDMRYLEGKISGNQFYMSGFDGGRTSIFRATIASSSAIEGGTMMTSIAYKPSWKAIKDSNAKIAESKDIIRVKEGIKTFKFAVKDLEGKPFTSDDPSLKGKVVVVQASGSWCPNCLDDTRLFQKLHEKYNAKGLEVVSLMFEENDLKSSRYRIERFVSQTGAKYRFYYAGPRSKKNKDEVLYPLEGVVAFPTTIFIDKKGEIRKVHTGFSGPGTGSHYEKLVEEITTTLEELLKE